MVVFLLSVSLDATCFLCQKQDFCYFPSKNYWSSVSPDCPFRECNKGEERKDSGDPERRGPGFIKEGTVRPADQSVSRLADGTNQAKMNNKVGINGFGRVGRISLRIALERDVLNVVAINDPFLTVENMAYLFKYDSNHGPWKGTVEAKGGNLIVAAPGKKQHVLRVSSERDPADIPWGKNEAAIVLECSRMFKTKEKASRHLLGGAKKVIITTISPDTPLISFGTNHLEKYNPLDDIISTGCCATTAMVPLLKILDEEYKITSSLISIIHCLTMSCNIQDSHCAGAYFRNGRASIGQLVVDESPLLEINVDAVRRILPNLTDNLKMICYRVPTQNVCLIDLTLRLEKDATKEEIIQTVRNAAETKFKGILGVTDEQLVSSDLMSLTYSSMFDVRGAFSAGKMHKLLLWFDNEYSFSSRLNDLVEFMVQREMANGFH